MVKLVTKRYDPKTELRKELGTAADLETPDRKPDWCPGCGDFGILRAVKDALFELKIPRHETVVVSGIGCGSKAAQWINTYGFHTLHGRSLPVASGIKLANPKLNVIDISGDGDCYGIGLGHFMHSCRRNINMVLITQDNQVYGLTKGQTAPTAAKNFKTNSTPFGVIEQPINPMALALAGEATFIARTFSGNLPHMKEMIKKAMQHNGFAVVDIFQPCITFNKVNTFSFFHSRVYDLQKENHDTSSKEAAYKKALETEKLPIGIFYQKEGPAYEDELPKDDKTPVALQDISKVSVKKLIEYYS